MYQIKMFHYQGQDVENEINKWLRDNRGLQIVDIKYNFFGNDKMATIIYRVY